MAYFSTRKLFLTPSFDLPEEEVGIFDKYYIFLEKSGVSEIIKKYENNTTSVGGRPNVNYYNLFAVILYGFAYGRETLREIEEACQYDIRFISIMEEIRPSYTTISNFINKVIVPNEEEIFGAINKQIMKELNIDIADVFIDGTKFEANANKYKFVWKPIRYHEKITGTFFKLLSDNKICQDFHKETLVKSSTIALSIDRLFTLKGTFDEEKYLNLRKTLEALLLKVIEYEEKEEICGPNRKSYYKTDHDATAMALKADYYSGLGSTMHAAYNTQIAVSKGLVLAYYISQARTDITEFTHIMDKFKRIYETCPKNVCADAGYGSLVNYRYLKENGIGNYVKYQLWEGNVSGSNPECYRLNDDNSITCLNGNIGNKISIPYRHPKKADGAFFNIEGCNECSYTSYCKKNQKVQDENFKIFEVSIEFQREKQKAEANLLSKKGIELRVNRSIQVEGVFGITKQNKGYTRTRRRGLTKVSTEMMLTFLGLNIKKLFDYYKTNKQPKFWVAPEDLEPESFRKPSAKRLSKKGIKINNKIYKN